MVPCGESTETHSDLDQAACSALLLAKKYSDSEPVLGHGVPADALERGRRILAIEFHDASDRSNGFAGATGTADSH
jgi:hypothetical protein